MSMDVPENLRSALAERYRIERELGEGGMATVYLASDVRHDRKVALKVLKPELAAVVGAERFLAEIKTTANLQHPHILPLFDSGEADGFLFYVMPYVEGESLRARLDRERQLPVDEAVQIARDVAAALDHAHGHGVIHRDIKPANILLSSGRPLVSDFGIALAVSAAGGGRLTETGMSLGTPHYMSPEQATAEITPGPPSDVYSLGCVLYEMLVGQPPFTGGTAQAVLAKIITGAAPEVTQERPSVPAHVERAILRALEKVPADRPQSAGDFARMLAQGLAPAASRAARAAGAPRRLWPTALASALVVAGAGYALGRASQATRVTDAATPLTRLSVSLPDSAPLAFVGAATLGVGRRALAISRDRSTLVYVGERDGVARLYVRPLDSFQSRELAGTEGAFSPFLSPNGLWVGYFVENELRKVRIDGGEPITLAEVPNSAGADWGEDGRIIAGAGEGTRLLRIPEQGGAAESVGTTGGDQHQQPKILPDGSVLMAGYPAWILDVETGEVDELPITTSDIRYLDAGFLVFTQGSAVHAVRFDLRARAVSGPSVPVVTGVRAEVYGQSQFDVSRDGTLVYAPGGLNATPPLVWAWPDGRVEVLPLPPRSRGTFELSPDDSRLAVAEIAAGQEHIWVYDLDTGRPLQLTVEPGGVGPVFWSPDGVEVVYNRDLPGAPSSSGSPQIRRSDGGGPGRPVVPELGDSVTANGWSAGGLITAERILDEVVIDPRSGEVTPIPTPDATSWGLVVSPNSDAVAYTSEHTGEYHVYVQPFPPTGEVQQVSLSGGAEEPLWCRDGRHLYYRHGRRIMVATVTTSPTLEIGPRQVFFEGSFVNVSHRSYDITADESRALVIDGGVTRTGELRVVQGWMGEVERLVREAEGSVRAGR